MPDLTPYRQQARAQNNLRVVRNARPDPNTPQLGDFVQAAGEFVGRIESARAEQEVVDTELKARREYDAAYRELEQDGEGNYEEFESRLMERSREVRGKILEGVKSGAARKAVEGRLDQIETGYVIRTRDLQRTRAVEDVKAGLIARTSALEETAKDPSVPFAMPDNPNVRSYAAEQEVVLAEINSMQRKGFLAKDDAERMRVQIEAQGRGAQSLRHTSTIDTLMDKGLHTEAEEYFKTHYGEISPETREKIESAIEVKGIEQQAVRQADDFMLSSDNDYGKAMEKARKVKDVDLRLKIESRLTTMKEQDNQASALEQKDVKEGLLDHVIGGGSLASAPADLVRRADAFTLDYIQQEQRQRQVWAQQMSTLSAQERAAVTQLSAIGKDHLQGFRALEPEVYMMGPEHWKTEAPGMHEAYQLLKPEHRSEIVMDIRKRQASGNTFDTTDGVFKDLIAQVPMLGPENRKGKDFAKGSDGKGAKRTYSKEEAAVRASLYQQAQEHAKRTGGADITPQESRVMIARAFREFDPKRYEFKEPGRFVGELSGAVMTSDAYLTTQDFLREKLDREPTPDEVLKAMSELEE
ncbi:MAG: hypothetical protein GOVbin52_39 [Prokaryotic dsDNA virus sp.]|nr:MAG: hypothetical protein GOVbin52_39 [Prokaryotic dsDNA virus sp.]|tara:strand:+ start:21866 stop:23614 length:1749 start_codon:yes stop_codon:yes gene_type:complete